MLVVKDETTIGSNIFDAPEVAKIVTVNTVGAMGRGIALDCKKKWPKVYNRYRAFCRSGMFTQDKLLIQRTDETILILFPTKKEWWKQSNLKDILFLCNKLERACKHWEITSVAIPPLGLANGWLNGDAVNQIHTALETAFKESDVSATFYLPEHLIKKLEESK